MGRRRGGRARPSAFQIELSTMPMSGPHGLYFPYSFYTKGYDMSSFNPQYTGGRISEPEVRSLVDDINNNPLTQITHCDPLLWLFCLVLICMAAGTPLYMTNAASSTGSGTGGFIMGFIFIPIGGMFTIITIMCISGCKNVKRMRLRKIVLDSIINRHQQQVFAPKQAVAKISPHGSYLMIQFCWQGAPTAQPQMNPAAMMMMAY